MTVADTIRSYGDRKSRRKWAHDRRVTVGSSEIGMCARRVSWQKAEPELVSGSWGAALRGTVIEERLWLPAMRKKWGDRLLYAGRDQKTLVKGDLSSTPDGILVNLTKPEMQELLGSSERPGPVVVECKSIDPRINLPDAKAEHLAQVQCQLGLLRDTTAFCPRYAVVSYVNASFWDDVAEFVVEYDDKVYQAAKRRAKEILSTPGEDLRPEGLIAGGKECEHCPFVQRCSKARYDSLPPSGNDPNPDIDRAFADEVKGICEEIRGIEKEANKLSEEVNKLKYDVRDKLKQRGLRKVPGVVSWSPVSGRISYDMDSLREAATDVGLDVDEFKKEGNPSDRLSILL